jgi:hypothetical protein
MEDLSMPSPKRMRTEEGGVKTRRGPWTVEEDELLTLLVKKYGTKKWAIIAELVPGRVGKQCRERWLNHLRTDVLKTAWTYDEDVTLINAQHKLGNRWSAIARLLPGRPENSVKNRWNSLINKKKRGMDDPESANVSVDDQSSGECSEASSFEDHPGLAQRVRRMHNRSPGRVSGEFSECGTDSSDAPSCAVLPVTTPKTGSPQTCTFGLKTVPWNPSSQMSGVQPIFGTYRGAPLHTVMEVSSHPRLFHNVLSSNLSLVSPLSPSSTTSKVSSHEDSKGAAQGLLLLAALCT